MTSRFSGRNSKASYSSSSSSVFVSSAAPSATLIFTPSSEVLKRDPSSVEKIFLKSPGSKKSEKRSAYSFSFLM